MSNFNGSAFFKASGNNAELSRSMFLAAFGLSSYDHCEGASLEMAIADFKEMEAFNTGTPIIVFDNCINKFDHDYFVDETITFDKDGIIHYVRASGCGNCNKKFHFSDIEEFDNIRDKVKDSAKFTKYLLLAL